MKTQDDTIVRIAVPTPLRRHFDYLFPFSFNPLALQPGVRLRVPFQRRELTGFFVELVDKTDVPLHKLKAVIEVIDAAPVITAELWALCVWAADYYHYALGEVLAHALPGLLRQGKELPSKISPLPIDENAPGKPLLLNAAQQNALTEIEGSLDAYHAFLLEGVTGSGKTEVYLQAIARVLGRGQQVLVLVPEIGLTPQTIQRFRARFAVPIAAMHSGMTEKQRLNVWMQAKSGGAKIVIGTRSAVFVPFVSLGLIIIDEEHDLSFKQQEGFRYNARDIAIMRAYLGGMPIVMGSATPSLETQHNADQGRFRRLQLPERAGGAVLPEFCLLDTRHTMLEQGLSLQLLDEIKRHLSRGDQVMLFLNRRGFSPVLFCDACGWMAKCTRCDARMTYHYRAAKLRCHHCDAQKNIPVKCEGCGVVGLQAVGQGTERLEGTLKKYFPSHSIARIDRDNMRRKGALEEALARIQRGDDHILVGTQMLAKGHHFPNVTLVALIDVDGGFFSADFRALERMGQLLLQVAGRAGRAEKPGKVLIQTQHPDHPLLGLLLQQNYHAFSVALLKERQEADLPPFVFFALFRAESHQLQQAEEFLNEIKSLIASKRHTLEIMGPIAAPMPRRAGRYRMQLLLQAKSRHELQQNLKKMLPEIEALKANKRVRWSLDVDPQEMF